MYISYLGIVLVLLIAARLQQQGAPGPRLRVSWIHVLVFFLGVPALIYQIVWQRSLFALYGAAIVLVLLVAARLQDAPGARLHVSWIHVLFFFSGAPALIYQIVWQRSLFALYGVNVESVAAVVSAFMLGLGLGSLLGGRLSRLSGISPLTLFGCAELCIALFGLVSLRFFHLVAERTAGAKPLTTGLLSFALLAVPTILMGATLPLLITHLVSISRNVAFSVGTLYFVNTLGSATACFFSADVLMRFLGQSRSVLVAASMNAVIGTAALYFSRARKSNAIAAGSVVPSPCDTSHSGRFGLRFGILLSCVCGFLALAYEIVWYRVYNFATGGSAHGFAYVLGSYLAGIALGSVAGEKFARTATVRFKIQAISAAVSVSATLAFLLPPTFGFLVRWLPLPIFFVGVAVITTTIGFIFPLISDLTLDPDPTVGQKFSYLYLANIAGSTLGSLLVGFVLMDWFPLAQLSSLLLVAGLLVAAFLAIRNSADRRWVPTVAMSALALIGVAGGTHLYRGIYYNLQYKTVRTEPPFAHVVENKSGVITVTENGTVFGGGIYDGVFNVSLENDRNLIIRTFAAMNLQPNPRRVLMVGLSSGSWGQIIANHPKLETLQVVEINPGYLQLIPQYPMVASFLHNPKVRITIDDGRRWLIAHPNEKYDFIVMNTTYAWREHASNLLSTEFLEMCKRHLLPGGVLFFNTTDFDEARATALAVFPYSLRIMNFIAASDHPLEVDRARWREEILNYRIDGKPVIDTEEALTKVIRLCNRHNIGGAFNSLETESSMRKRYSNVSIITDDNMGVEWNY